MPDHNFRIRKLTDKELVEKLREVATQCGFEKINVRIPLLSYTHDVAKQDWFTDPTIQKAMELNSMVIQSLNMWVGQGVHVTVSREMANPLTDAAALNVPNNIHSAGTSDFVLKVMKVVQEVFKEVTPPIWDMAGLSAELKTHYTAREQYVAKQERELSNFFLKMQDFTLAQTTEHNAKLKQLQDEFTERQRVQDVAHQERMAELDKRDAEFDKKKAEFDLQEARGMRRKLRSDQKEELKKLIERFTLTPETQAKRTPVWFAAIGAILVLLAISLYLMFGQSLSDPQSGFNYLLFVRQITFSIATVGFVWYFIHWSNRWFQRHADEELRLKRLLLDLDRASWVFEMILDWQKETKQEFPVELLKQLAKNLYATDGTCSDEQTQADVFAALIGAAANVKMKAGGAEVEFDRKSLQTLDKKS